VFDAGAAVKLPPDDDAICHRYASPVGVADHVAGVWMNRELPIAGVPEITGAPVFVGEVEADDATPTLEIVANNPSSDI
jgi:hypothetical protein